MQLPTWISGVPTPFGGLVKFYFRRHLERAAAQKHGAAGVEAAREKQAARKEKRAQSRVDDKESKVAQLDELLKANGIEGGYRDLHLLGPNLTHAVHLFIDPKTAGKKRRGCVFLFALCVFALTKSLLPAALAPKKSRSLRSLPSSRRRVRLLFCRSCVLAVLIRKFPLRSRDSQGARALEAPRGARRGVRAGRVCDRPLRDARRAGGLRCVLHCCDRAQSC